MEKLLLKLLIIVFAISINTKSFAQWETVYYLGTPTNLPWLNSVYFTDNNNGMTVGNGSAFPYEHKALILRTSDNGMTWDTVFISSDTLNFRDIVFTNTNTAVTVGDRSFCCNLDIGIIAKTTDFGNTWDTIMTNKGLLSVSFPSSNIGYTVGYDGVILKTTDEGDSWTQLSSGVTNHLRSVVFINDTIGFAAGQDIVLKTIDGGNNWISQSIGSGNIRDMFFPSENIGYLLVRDYSESIYIYKTIDSGNTWNLHYPFDNSWFYLSSIFFPNDTIGYLCGAFHMSKTIDGGLSWNMQTASPPGNTHWMDDIMDVFFLNADIGFAVGLNQFYRTTNGGELIISDNKEINRHTNNLVVYPNPVEEILNIELPVLGLGEKKIEIFNSLGQIVLAASFLSLETSLDLTDLRQGIYFLQISEGNTVLNTEKFIKK